jgi:L-cystine uptake protein TcyP (sodium:dicarboxylate symporter family)
MYMRPAEELTLAPAGGSPPRELLLSAAVLVAMLVNVGSFFAVEPLIDLARDAASSLQL